MHPRRASLLSRLRGRPQTVKCRSRQNCGFSAVTVHEVLAATGRLSWVDHVCCQQSCSPKVPCPHSLALGTPQGHVFWASPCLWRAGPASLCTCWCLPRRGQHGKRVRKVWWKSRCHSDGGGLNLFGKESLQISPVTLNNAWLLC